MYRTVLYGAETWATKGQACKRKVNEMRMLTCACGVKKKDKTTHEHVTGSVKVASVAKMIGEESMEWCGHVNVERGGG